MSHSPSTPTPGAAAHARLRRQRNRLLSWYDGARRRLPWREQPTPYRVLVSELMLQQTQVDTVLPYFERFVTALPDFAALAAAPLDRVLELWSGLGYYRRARHLHAAAQAVVAQHAGALPDDLASLKALPGIGPYTAGAVLSIAFDQAEPLVDGNVERVLARWLALDGDPREKAGKAAVHAAAAALVPGPRPGDLNQALMELGALVCRPSDPACGSCPLGRSCLARRQNRQAEIPPVRQRAARQPLRLALAVVRDGQRLLLRQRAETGLFAGLWELPSVELPGRAGPARIRRALEDLLGCPITLGAQLAVVERTLSHRDLTLEAYAVTLQGPLRLDRPHRHTTAAQRRRLGLATAMREVLKKLEI